MLISVDDYRDVSGDITTSDALVSAAIVRMQARIESYIQRNLESQEYVEKHIHITPHPIMLKE